MNQSMSGSRTQNQSGVVNSDYEDKLAQAIAQNGELRQEMQKLKWLSVDMPAKIEFLKSAIACQQITLRLQTTLAAIFFILGITVVILSFVNPGLILAETLKTGLTLGGAVIAASGFIPIVFSRRDRIVPLRSLLLSYQHQQVGGLSPDAKLDQYFDQYLANLGD